MGANGQTLSTVLLLVVGTGGIGAAIAAIIKLPRERNSAAVTEAQGNAAAATNLLKQVSEDRDYWRDRALASERRLTDETKRADQAERLLEHERRQRGDAR